MPLRDPRLTSAEDLFTEILRRLRKLETRKTATVGSGTNTWLLEVNTAGDLVARHPATGTTTTLASPASPP